MRSLEEIVEMIEVESAAKERREAAREKWRDAGRLSDELADFCLDHEQNGNIPTPLQDAIEYLDKARRNAKRAVKRNTPMDKR